MADEARQRYRVSEGEHLGTAVISLADWEAETQAILVPSSGFSCIAFRLRLPNREGWHVLAEPPDAESLRSRAGRYGIPILFPWPNRIRGGRFTFGVTEYHVPTQAESGNASHGLIRDRAWQVDATGTDADGAFCRASSTLGDREDDPWPFECRLTMEYRLRGQSLHILAEAENLGGAPMPMGFGLHPWFTVPFVAGGARGSHELRVPADRVWELESNLPTGEIDPASRVFDARDWRALDDTLLDDVYTDLTLTDGWFTAELRDPASGRQISVRSNTAFREHVVYAPLHLPAVCLEPYTCATDAFNLAARGIDGGMLVLEPGTRWRGRVVIEASA
jgi:aldose 1-epimerase